MEKMKRDKSDRFLAITDRIFVALFSVMTVALFVEHGVSDALPSLVIALLYGRLISADRFRLEDK